ncbi:MAG: molybdenum cofactor guanylyltransferase [Candidatus Hodarchaeota archaeon]
MTYHVAILAGGRSKRFGSNKALFKIDGIALISKFLLEIPKLARKPNVVFISLAGQEQLIEIIEALKVDLKIIEETKIEYKLLDENDDSTSIPMKIIFDDERENIKEFRAAIFGLQAIFTAISEGIVQIMPCDTPYFNANIMNILHAVGEKAGDTWDALIPRWKNGYIEPLHGIYKVDACIDPIEENIKKGDLRLRHFLQSGIRVKHFMIEKNLEKVDPTYKTFQNFNTREFLPS